jgi:hypothetical protein
MSLSDTLFVLVIVLLGHDMPKEFRWLLSAVLLVASFLFGVAGK